MPMIMPALLIASMLRALDAFRIFDLPYVLTGGGPADSTEVLSTLSYKMLFSGSQYGLGSATTVLMFLTESRDRGALRDLDRPPLQDSGGLSSPPPPPPPLWPRCPPHPQPRQPHRVANTSPRSL